MSHKRSLLLTDKKLKTAFSVSDLQSPIDETRKAETLVLLSQAAQAGANCPVPDKKLLLLHLIRYLDRNPSLLHLTGCAVMFLLLLAISIWDVSTETMIFISMMLPLLLACLSAFEIRQICFVKIAELSDTCFFHVKQLASLSIALSGVINLMAISAGILLIGFKWKIKLIHVGLYILVPFIFMQCICLGTMLTEAGRKYTWLNTALSIPLVLFCAVIVRNRTLYTEFALLFWVIALLAGIILLTAETRIFFIRLEKGDIICTNWN